MDLLETRQKIDDVDQQIFTLLQERMELVHEIGKFKEENGICVRDVRREKRVLDKIADSVSPEYAPWVKEIYKELMSVCRNFQKVKLHIK